jgi:hypothetical protein
MASTLPWTSAGEKNGLVVDLHYIHYKKNCSLNAFALHDPMELPIGETRGSVSDALKYHSFLFQELSL